MARSTSATGGDLVPKKCFWYLIDFTWNHNQWTYKQWENKAHSLSIHQVDGTSITILHLSTSEAWQMLGIQITPNGNNNAKYVHLWEEAMQWQNNMVAAKLNWSTADFWIRQVLLPKLRFPLVATTFSEGQCNAIMQPVLQQGLPALGVNRNFPCAIAHGPTAYQGLNLPNLHLEQLVSHITTLLKYGPQCNDPTGTLIQACGELMCLEASECGPLFQISPHLHVCVTETWLSHCWHLCVQCSISITEDIQDFVVPHHHDWMLMHL